MAKLSNLASVRQNVGLEVLQVTFAAGGATNVASAAGDHETIRVIYGWIIPELATPGASTCQLFNGAVAITDAVSTNVAINLVTRFTTIDDAAYDVAPGTALNVTTTGAQTGDCYILVQRIQPT